ncbi:MAG: glycosyltransferase family 4 protein [Bacteroidota bacterium]
MKSRIPVPSLRIAFVCFSSARGGLELMLVCLADSLRQAGHSLIVVSPRGSAIEEECSSRGLRHYPLTPYLKYLDLFAAWKLRGYFVKHSTQVVVVGTSKDISTVAIVKRSLRSLRIVYFQQMQSGLMKKDFFHGWAHGQLDRWITLTGVMKESTLNTTTVPAGLIDVVPLGVNLEHFDPSRYRRRVSRKRFGLPKDKRIVGLIGRLDPQKGQETFLRAAPIVLKKLPKTCFVLVGEETRGEPGFREQLRQLVEDQGIGSSVQFLPFTDRIPEMLASFDLTAMPSFSESYGYLAIESMAMGIPVVGTNAGGLPEILEDQKTGILIPPRDHQALAKAILSLLSNRRLHSAMARRARLRAIRYFDYGDGVRRFQDSIFRALSGRD